MATTDRELTEKQFRALDRIQGTYPYALVIGWDKHVSGPIILFKGLERRILRPTGRLQRPK